MLFIWRRSYLKQKSPQISLLSKNARLFVAINISISARSRVLFIYAECANKKKIKLMIFCDTPMPRSHGNSNYIKRSGLFYL